MRRRCGTGFLAIALIVGVVAALAPVPAPGAAQAGKLVFCSDMAFPPMEFLESGKPTGADIDIGTEVAKRLGRTAEFANVGFDGIIAALQANRCDAIISGMNNTPERAKAVDFVNYLSVGQSLMVPKGNPLKIDSFETLCGHTGAAQVGSTNLDALKAASAACQQAGKPAIDVVGLKTDTDGVLALKANRIDAYESDSPVIAYYISQDPTSFQFGGKAINAIPVGIAVRKDETALRADIQKAIDGMYADGTMAEILAKWQLSDFALTIAATPVATPAGTPAQG
ncbi:MAG TPA: ABC transporter substrate-binding protein [Thermomicrobiales bacterium]|nr:ABC transporter substrate-binding protein [Thermomicrobiales bacterium]